LEGQRDGVEDQVKNRLEDGELPSAGEMKEMAYLLPQGSERFARTGADYEKDNLTALWIRDVDNKVYDEVIKPMVAEQNRMIISGGDVKLVDAVEDDPDRDKLINIFQLSLEEKKSLQSKLDGLENWCTDQEQRLMDVLPPAGDTYAPELPEVEPPNDIEKELQDYKPLLDVSQLKGQTASDVRNLIAEADAAIGRCLPTQAGGPRKEFDGFQVSSLPRPNTHPDMPECKIVPYPLSVKDIPQYEMQANSELVRQPAATIADPFPRPFLHLPYFEENVMPVFEGAMDFENPRALPPQACKEAKWLCKTRSIFADNNIEESADEPAWGKVPPRERPRVPMIDEPYQPPYDMVLGTEGKRLVIRGMWDPELYSPELPLQGYKAEFVPPIRERGHQLYREPEFEHPDKPIWSSGLAPIKGRVEKVNSMCKIVPIRSFARFMPNKITADIPDFLWHLARDDPSGQNLWTVVRQRFDVPEQARKEEEAREAEAQRVQAEEEAAIKRTIELEDAALAAVKRQDEGDATSEMPGASPASAGAGGADFAAEALDEAALPVLEEGKPEAPVPAPLAIGPKSSADATAYPTAFEGEAAPAAPIAVPIPEGALAQEQVQITLPEGALGQEPDQTQPPPQLPPAPGDFIEPSGGTGLSPTAAAAATLSPTSRQALQRAASKISMVRAFMPKSGPGSPKKGDPLDARREESMKSHEERVVGLGATGDILSDEKMLDTLADKIATRLGVPAGTMGSTMYPGSTQGSWAGAAGGASGQTVGRLQRPDPPSFAEPEDKRSRAELPPPLRNNEQTDRKGGPLRVGGVGQDLPPPDMAATVSDVNHFTMEKMRGECYVRLLINPEASAARKDPIPYRGTTVPPDVSLVTGAGRPLLRMAPREKKINEEGEFEEEDPYAEFEPNNTVVFSFVRHNRYESVEALIQQNLEILASKDENGNNLLHVACQNNNRRIAKLLLNNNIHVNEANSRGNTPLHYAYQYGFTQLAEFLMANNADETIPNKAGLRATEGIGRDDPVGNAQQDMRAQRNDGL
jgi:hypothetical protein